MKRFILIFVVLFTVNFAFSQSHISGKWLPGYVYNKEYFDLDKPKPLKYTGNPYLEDDFKYGSINDEDGNSRNAFLRYNAIEEIVELKFPEAEQSGIQILPKVKSISYSLNDYKYIFDSFITGEGEIIEGYLIEYYDGGNIGLYGNPLPKLTEARYAKITLGHGRLPHLGVEVEYFIKNEDGKLLRTKLRDRDFIKVLPKSAELNKYLAENKLKTPQDYALMLEWLNSISSL